MTATILLTSAAATVGALSYALERYRRVTADRRRHAGDALLSQHRLNFEEASLAIADQTTDIQDLIYRTFKSLPSLRPETLVSSSSGRYIVEASRRGVRDPVIVKFVDPTDNHRELVGRHALFNEAFALSILDGRRSPRLLQLVETKAASPVLIRESVVGASADRAIVALAEQAAPPTFGEVQSFLNNLGAAVAEVHHAGLIHGDIKPANIVGQWINERTGSYSLGACRDLHLIDFESSALIHSSWSEAGQLRGTPRYMAPERYAFVKGSPASDVYSCTALAAFLLTGRPERPGTTAVQRIPGTPLREAVRRGLHINLLRRQDSIEQWLSDMNAGFDSLRSEIDIPVKWPLDPIEVRRELSAEAISVSMTPYSRVLQSVDASTIDTVMQTSYADLPAHLRRSLDLWWFERMDFEEVANIVGRNPEELEREVDSFLLRLGQRIEEISQPNAP